MNPTTMRAWVMYANALLSAFQIEGAVSAPRPTSTVSPLEAGLKKSPS